MTEYYELRILVRHPTLPKEHLLTLFGDGSDHSVSAGERGKTYSFWSTTDRVTGERAFSRGLTRALEWLEERSTAVSDILRTGGNIEVILQLPGDRNIGDTLDANELARA